VLKIFFFHLLTIALFAEHLIVPIPINNTYNKKKALLGKELFSEKNLSTSLNLACIDCHNLFDDDKISTLIKKTQFNPPTVMNAVYNYKLFWDGRVSSLEEQVRETLESNFSNKNEEKLYINLLKSKYENKFKKIYKDGFLLDNIIDAIVEFEKALTTPNSRFDKYLKGEINALNQEELIGYEIFKAKGCMACHNGVNMGGNAYSKLEITNNEESIYKGCYGNIFNARKTIYSKVPSLRNVSLTGPYFHNGSVVKLDEAIKQASLLALRRELSTNDISSLTIFLKTLKGEKPVILNENIDDQ